MNYLKKYFRIFLNIVIPIAVCFLLYTVGIRLVRFFMPFVIAWIISLIANPIVWFLEKRVKIVRKHSSVLLIIAVLALIIGVGYWGIAKIITELSYFVKELPNITVSLKADLEGILDKMQAMFTFLPQSFFENLDQFTENLYAYIGDFIGQMGAPTVAVAGSVAKSIPDIFISVVMTILASYFFIADKEKINKFVSDLVPVTIKEYWVLIFSNLKHLIGGYFAAQFKIMGVVAIILFVGFTVLRIKYSVLLALLIAFLDFLPFFGTGTALIPWALFQLYKGNYYLAVGLGIIYVVSQVVRQLIQPKIVGDSLGLNPMATLVFLYIGYKFKGIAGMILAVPIGVLMIEFFKYGVFDSMINSIKEVISDINSFRKGELTKKI